MSSDDILRSLQAALEASPDNPTLRLHLADVLMQLGRAAEAADILVEAVRLSPTDSDAKLALVRAYRAADKTSAAHVILEEIIRVDEAIARARIERARTFLVDGEVEAAVREYHKALDEDPEVADPELAERLGIKTEAEPDHGILDEGRFRESADPEDAEPGIDPMEVEIDFEDIGGMEDLKKDIRRKIIHPLKHPEIHAAYGKKVGGGILLYGPPGCGKTHIARATAGEIDAKFKSVGIHEVLDMWIGRSERNLHQVFEIARANRPCVLFFDEADALGASRGDLRTSAGRQTINQFLAELDGLSANNDGLLVLAATNAPWQMDPAFRRPGRFDRVVFVPPPDEAARVEILRILLRDKPQQDIDHRAISKRTDRFSGADLKAVVDAAIELKLDAAIDTGEVSPITTKDLLKAAKKRAPTTGEWFQTVRNHVLYANDDGLYNEIKPYLKL